MKEDIDVKGAIETLIANNGKTINGKDLEENPEKAVGMMPLPYKTSLSFEPLIRFIKKEYEERGYTESVIFKTIGSLLEESQVLCHPMEDASKLEDHKQLVDLLIASVIPVAEQEHQLAKVSMPFTMIPFFQTKAVERMMQETEVSYEINRSSDLLYCAAVISACSLVLNRFYGQDLKVAPPVSVTAKKKGQEAQQYFRMNLNTSFIDILPLKELKVLSQEEINKLLTNIYDIDAWLEAIPADAFEFSGFAISTLIEITEEESVSRLKQSLLQPNAIVNRVNVKNLENLVRNYLGVPGLRLGITAIDYPRERSIAHKYKIRFDFLADQIDDLLDEAYENSIYDKACKYREFVLVEDLKKLEHKTVIEEELLKQGFRSVIIAPLFNKNKEVIGLLEIGSKAPYALHSFIELKFQDITELFSIAVERSRREIDNQIEAVIREEFTDIHPSVEWRFIETAYNLMEKRESGEKKLTPDPIIFHDVYPLYGQADIVGSSKKRNTSIQADLLDNLSRVRKVLSKAATFIQFPLMNKFIMEVDLAVQDLNEEFNSNDESKIVDLLHNNIHPGLALFQRRYPELGVDIEEYFSSLDSELQIIYQQRKAYEDSVTMVNTAIGTYLDGQDKILQKVLPHYYTKYTTDGVEYNLYFGESLLNKDEFCSMHLHNFRLQQLVDMVEITRLVHQMQGELPEPLDTAQLVFAYTNTLSIRFREDEKQFDVDGAYNVRYEILKKRIDKAVIEGTTERLTQAGKVAVVYLQDKDRQEYLEYFKYLDHQGMIEGEVEEMTLGKLQGAQGLRALRFTVKHES